MELTQRKLKILKAVVDSYIENGKPVGSKLLCGELDFPVSSATVRNEMAELSDLGLLTQPHTSAGRIPSEEGYRYYVNYLMEKKKLPTDVKAIIYDAVYSSSDDPEKLLKTAGDLVARFADACVIVTTPSSKDARIRSLKFVQTGRQTCMVVLIASTGLIKTKLFRCDYVITPDIVRVYETIFNRSMSGLPVKSVTPAYIQTMAVEMGELAMLVPDVLAAIMQTCGEVGSFGMTVSGRVNLLFEETADLMSMRLLTAFLHSDEALESLVIGLNNEQKILIGADTGINALQEHSVLSQPYTVETQSSGLITAIVPMKSDYAYISSIMDYVSECVSGMLRNLLMIEE